MKSFFNSLYTITKAPKKLKATPNAVDLAMDLLLPSQARRHRGESAYHQFKTTNFRQRQKSPVKKLKISPDDCLFCSNLYDTSGMI